MCYVSVFQLSLGDSLNSVTSDHTISRVLKLCTLQTTDLFCLPTLFQLKGYFVGSNSRITCELISKDVERTVAYFDTLFEYFAEENGIETPQTSG